MSNFKRTFAANIKPLAISIMLIISLIPILSASPVLSSQPGGFNDNPTESHIIEDVPYVSQEMFCYCGFASTTMLIKYYVNDVTLKEILFHSGIGYSTAYFRLFKEQAFPGAIICQLSGNGYLGEIYGLSPESWKAERTGDQWEQYWSKLKEKITQDIPISTSIDPFVLPWYKEHLPGDTQSGHGIVIVGFNESSGVVYYNDPGPTALGEDEKNCTYVTIPIETLREAVENTMGTKYLITSFEKTSSPISKEEAFLQTHERNIERIKGYYSEKIYKKIPFTDYGIEAIKAMRKDLRIGIRHRFATMVMMKIFKIANFTIHRPKPYPTGQLCTSFMFLKAISIEKQNISQYLLENQDLSPICAYETVLLAEEAKHWGNLSVLDDELFQAAHNRFFKTIIESKPIIEKMKKELDQIISIEEAIIAGPSMD